MMILELIKGGFGAIKGVAAAFTSWIKDRSERRLIQAGEDKQRAAVAEQALKDNRKAQKNENDVKDLNDDDLFNELRDGAKDDR